MIRRLRKSANRWLVPSRLLLIRKTKRGKTIYLTFDDGPTPDATSELLTLLDSHDIYASYFVPGKNVESNKQLIRETCDVKVRHFRAPRGRWGPGILWHLWSHGIQATHWRRDSLDYQKLSAEQIVCQINERSVEPGEIILFHDDYTLRKKQGFDLKALS